MTQISAEQYKALYEIFTNAETLQEFQSLKIPGRVSWSGAPFKPLKDVPQQPSSPILNQLFQILLACPGFKEAPLDQICNDGGRLLEALAANDLSDSFDKGSLSRRKIIGVGICVIAEKAFRGITTGVKREKIEQKKHYDLSKAEDVIQGWELFMQELIYSEGAAALVKLATETSELKDLPLYIQAAHQYATVICASFLHYVLCVSAAGPTIVTLLDRVQAQLPYGSLRSGLKVVNAGTGASVVGKVLFSNSAFFGSSKRNLMLRVISSILTQDKEVIDAKIANLEKDAKSDKVQREAINKHVYNAPREQHQAVRDKSFLENRSIILIILEQSNVGPPADESIHQELLQYLTLSLSSRDRELMERTVCSDPNDSLTSALTSLLDSFKGIIRQTHKASDLPSAISALQSFLDDLIACARNESTPQGFFKLCLNHQGDLHVFLHDLCANSPDLVKAYAGWYSTSSNLYRREEEGPLGPSTKVIDDLLAGLSEQDLKTVLGEADAYSSFSDASQKLSRERFAAILKGEPVSVGPGTAIQIWDDLINRSAVRPDKLNGGCRFGADATVQAASQESEELDASAPNSNKEQVNVLPSQERPAVSKTKSLLRSFHSLLVKHRKVQA